MTFHFCIKFPYSPSHIVSNNPLVYIHNPTMQVPRRIKMRSHLWQLWKTYDFSIHLKIIKVRRRELCYWHSILIILVNFFTSSNTIVIYLYVFALSFVVILVHTHINYNFIILCFNLVWFYSINIKKKHCSMKLILVANIECFFF